MPTAGERLKTIVGRDRIQATLTAACVRIPQNADSIRVEGKDLCFEAVTPVEISSAPITFLIRGPHKERIGSRTAKLLVRLGIPDKT